MPAFSPSSLAWKQQDRQGFEECLRFRSVSKPRGDKENVMQNRFITNKRTRSQVIAIVLAIVSAIGLPRLTTVSAAAGDLDTTFNPPNGFATLPNSLFADVAIQPADGKILAVGQRDDGSISSLIVARFNTDGTLDSSFGTNGVATPVSSTGVVGVTIAVQVDGKIVAAGFDLPIQSGFFVTRFNANGAPDTTFGQDGSLTIHFGGALEGANSVAIGPGGTIVVAGSSLFGSIDSNPEVLVAIARLDSLGNLDPTFGTGGRVLSARGNGNDVAVLSDGRILVSGSVPDTLPTDFALLRFNTNGSPDTTFGGGDGIATAHFRDQDSALDMAVQSDGRVVLAGSVLNPGEPLSDALAQFDSDGNLDLSFDGDGKVIGPPSADSYSATGLAIQSDGAIVTVGSVAFGPTVSDVRSVVSRYTSNGSLDPAFGSGGRVIADFPGNWALSGGGAIQSDGKIVLVGAQTDQNQLLGLIARFLGNGGPPPPPPPPIFDICLQNDNSNAGRLIFKFNSATGAYEFVDCSKGVVLSGTGTIAVNSCKLDLTDLGPVKPSDRNISVLVNPCTKKGTVTITIKSPARMYGFTDNDITQGSCACP
jgi:uncharacterized delta-60 repeat protein